MINIVDVTGIEKEVDDQENENVIDVQEVGIETEMIKSNYDLFNFNF
jgi:hypothetical protein